jgi:hypothetical protein
VSAEREYEGLFSLKESWTLLCLSRCLPFKGDPMAALHEATLRDIRTAAAATIRNMPVVVCSAGFDVNLSRRVPQVVAKN